MQWTQHRWSPTAFSIDGSNIELKAIERKFGRARVLRCTRDSTENLKVKLFHVEDVLYHSTTWKKQSLPRVLVIANKILRKVSTNVHMQT